MEMPDALSGMDVLILAGGRGTRLQSLPGDVPKPLREVQGRPFLSYLLDQVRNAGARRAVLALGYKPDAFRDFVRDETTDRFEVAISVEAKPLGTGGAMRAALPLLSTESILAMNGDSYVGAALGRLAAAHRRRNDRITILLAKVDDASRYGGVEIDAQGAVLRFVEKGRTGPGLINAGVYILRRQVLEEIPAERAVSLEREVLPAQVGRGFTAETGEFPFLDIGTPESYRAAEAFFRKPGGPR
jgi:D-glycero-alpha-D-manno-heptose 1-phosphate guanylyltransferase